MNILLTGVGRRSYLADYFKDALAGKGRVFAANSKLTSAFQHADASIITPLSTDEKYIDFLLEYCLKNSIKAIISLFDIDAQVLSANRARFLMYGITPVVSSPEVMQICNDKWQTAAFLKSLRIAHPACYLSLNECKKAVRTKNLDFPLILKPRFGMGSIGFFEAENEQELEILHKKIHRIIDDTYLKYASFGKPGELVLIEEKIAGEEYGLDILNDLSGKYAGCAAKKKLAMRSGETDMALMQEPGQFEYLARCLADSLSHTGNLDVDLIVANNGTPYIIELNARFGGQYPFSHIAGVNYPLQIIKWLNKEKTDNLLLQYRHGLTICKEIQPVEIKKIPVETLSQNKTGQAIHMPPDITV